MVINALLDDVKKLLNKVATMEVARTKLSVLPGFRSEESIVSKHNLHHPYTFAILLLFEFLVIIIIRDLERNAQEELYFIYSAPTSFPMSNSNKLKLAKF